MYEITIPEDAELEFAAGDDKPTIPMSTWVRTSLLQNKKWQSDASSIEHAIEVGIAFKGVKEGDVVRLSDDAYGLLKTSAIEHEPRGDIKISLLKHYRAVLRAVKLEAKAVEAAKEEKNGKPLAKEA